MIQSHLSVTQHCLVNMGDQGVTRGGGTLCQITLSLT